MHVEAEVRKATRPIWALGSTAVSLAILIGVCVTGATSANILVAFALCTLMVAPIIAAATRRDAKPHEVDADVRGLSIDGRLVVPRDAIVTAHVAIEPDGRSAAVVEGRGLLRPRHIVRVDSHATAESLTRALETRTPDVAAFDVLPPWAHRMRWLTVALTTSPWILFNVLRHLPPFAIFVVLALYGLIALPMVLPQKVVIGEDGVLLRWAGSRRFIAYGAMKDARATALGIELELADERRVEIRITHRADGAMGRRVAMLGRIEEGIAAHRKRAPAEDAALLVRGSRSLEEWIDALEHGGAGYRANAIPRERLWEIVENPSADPSARQGAALALRAELDADERERLGAIAQKSVSPRLRVALAAVATVEDPPSLRVALEAADEEEDDPPPLQRSASR